jgi:large subunit ribosomal protein L15
MNLTDLAPAPGSTHRKKRIGRGPGSGKGTTAGKGHKGQKARTQVNPNFEGGQTPLHRRLPQLRGFKPVNKVVFAVVNLELLEAFDDGNVVDPAALISAGMVRSEDDKVKILGDGVLTKKLTVKADAFSKSAAEKVVAAGGTVEVLARGR